MRALRYIFSFHGRFSARDLWLHQWATAGVTCPVLIGVSAAFWQFTDGMSVFYGFGAAMFVQTIAHFSAIVRRLHDLGMSGWLGVLYPAAVTLLVSFFLGFSLPISEALSGYVFWASVGVIAAASLSTLLLYLVPGQRRDNRFGPVPFTRRPVNA